MEGNNAKGSVPKKYEAFWEAYNLNAHFLLSSIFCVAFLFQIASTTLLLELVRK